MSAQPSSTTKGDPKQIKDLKPQEQNLPGSQEQMTPKPIDEDPRYRGSGKLEGKVAIITGGDSGIGRAAAIAFAKEGADVAIVYLDEKEDAAITRRRIEELGRKCLTIAGDVSEESFCQSAVDQTLEEFGHLDIVVNNAAEQTATKGIEEIDASQLERTFRVNFFGYFYLTRAAVPHLKPGSAIINTTSVQAYEPSPGLMDYAATKGAILNFTRSLATELTEKGIRVNAVAPGPVWTPLIPGSFSAEKVKEFGKNTPMKRAAQPAEMAPAYVYLASEIDSSYMSGQVLHLNGGRAMHS
jgi:NAD(P)-dependent dehydrogenase (short-subunit alcohol dehydrogenase family)